MRKQLFLFAVIISTVGIHIGAQVSSTARPTLALWTQNPAVALELSTDSLTSGPANGYDGVVRVGPADIVAMAVGNVVITLNGTRVTANRAVWHHGSQTIELGDGSVRIELQSRVSGLKMSAAQ